MHIQLVVKISHHTEIIFFLKTQFDLQKMSKKWVSLCYILSPETKKTTITETATITILIVKKPPGPRPSQVGIKFGFTRFKYIYFTLRIGYSIVTLGF